MIFAAPCTLYLVVGWLLVFRYESFNGDAQARLANAYYVLFSRDPHLAAIGFVWNPLPSLAVLPLLPLKAFWPALTNRQFAGNIMSAIFMAGAAYQIYGFLRDLGLRRLVRLALIVVFALNPMIVYYGGNGMSEGLFIFTLVIATRYLARWLVDDRTIWLVISAAALGLAYLARNEAAFAALFAALVVVVVTFARASAAPRRVRVYRALTDGLAFGLPFAVCFVGWAIVSWVIVGHPFEQFQSVYGTASQLRVLSETATEHLTPGVAAGRALHAANSLAPALPVFMLAGLGLAWWRRDLRVLASLAMPGGVLAFAVVAYTLGQTAGWFRYYLMAVPLVVMLSGSIISSALKTGGVERRPLPSRWPPVAARRLLALIVVAAVAASVPSTARALLYGRSASEEQLHLGYILRPGPNQENESHRYASTVTIARALDDLHLRHGAILVDNFTPCVPIILLNSKHPQQFVIPNDEDFRQTLADPVTFHIEYLLVPPVGGYGELDAINREYPTLYRDGAGITTQVRAFALPGCPVLTLFKLNSAGPT